MNVIDILNKLGLDILSFNSGIYKVRMTHERIKREQKKIEAGEINSIKGFDYMKIKTVMTKGINSLLNKEAFTDLDLTLTLTKFLSNDWGILSNEDKEFQTNLLRNPKSIYEDRFMGVYIINEIKIWIIREYDFSIKGLLITILLPEEY
ncbi:hypothetical protein [Clostridium tertium]|uniref:hypothetical protein n=1 Tax=Clostridium tertium TaxID=1559 RepID=UPI00356A3038